MRMIEPLAWLASVSLIGAAAYFAVGDSIVKPSYASQIASEEIAKINAVAESGVAKINEDVSPFGIPLKPLLPSDVKLVVDGGHGSAVHIGNGIFLTAGHNLTVKTKTLKIKMRDGSVRPAEALWYNTKYDIGLVKADGEGLESADLQCREMEVGESITTLGNPTIMEFVTAFGKIAGEARTLGDWERVQVVDITILPGQSGGPVFDKDGKLVGITVGVATFGGGWAIIPTGFGFIVPGKAICPLLARS